MQSPVPATCRPLRCSARCSTSNSSSGAAPTAKSSPRPIAARIARRRCRPDASPQVCCSAHTTAGSTAAAVTWCACRRRCRACRCHPPVTFRCATPSSATGWCGCASVNRWPMCRASPRTPIRRSVASTTLSSTGPRRRPGSPTTSWTSRTSRSCTRAPSVARRTRWCRASTWSSSTMAGAATPMRSTSTTPTARDRSRVSPMRCCTAR